MTLTSETVRVQYNGDGVTVAFAVTFVFWDDVDLQVIHTDSDGVETTWVNGTQYTVTGGDGSTGTVTVDTSPTDYTPAAGETLTILSNLDDTQDTSLPAGGPLPSTSIEQRLDKIVRMIQQKEESIGRAIKLAVSAAESGIEIAEMSGNAGKTVIVNTDEDGFDFVDVTGGGELVTPIPIADGGTGAVTATAALTALGFSSFAKTIIDDANAAAVLTTLGISTFIQTLLDDANAAAARVTLGIGTTFRSGFIYGLVPSNAADATHDITMATGVVLGDDLTTFYTVPALTKQLDAAWAAGSAAGGLGNGLSFANGSWHAHVVTVDADSSVDIFWDTSVTGANVPTGTTLVRTRIFSIKVVSSALQLFTAREINGGALWLELESAGEDIDDTTDKSTQGNFTLPVPAGIEVMTHLVGTASLTGGIGNVAVAHPDTTIGTVGGQGTGRNTEFGGFGLASAEGPMSNPSVMTNTSSQIAAKARTNGAHRWIVTVRGWTDFRS